MLPLTLFTLPSFTGVQVAAFTLSASLYAMFLYLTLYLQSYLGHSPFETGLRYLPATVLVFICSGVAGALIGRMPARLLLCAGLSLTGLGLLLMSGIDTGDEWTTLLGGLLVAGAGSGLLNPVIAEVALSVVPKERSGMAAGINDTFRQVGIAVGIALWGANFIGRGADEIGVRTAGTPAADGERPRQLLEAASSGSLEQALAASPPDARRALADAAGEGFLVGLNGILVAGGLLSLAGAVLSLWLVREREIERQHTMDESESQVHARSTLASWWSHGRPIGRER
jgi:Major Facilitator Superfamily